MELSSFLCVAIFIAFLSSSYSKETPLDKRVSSLESIIQEMKEVIHEQSQQIKMLSEENAGQSKEITNLKYNCQTNNGMNVSDVKFTPGTYMKSSSCCPAEEISLSCPVGQTLFINSAEYGEYSRECTSSCCTPHPFDCAESMTTSNSDEWLILKLTCDDKTSCEYLFQGSTFIEGCTVSNVVDFLQVFYTCLPVSLTESIGFTAYHLDDRDYNNDDIVIFDGIISNMGGYYNPTTGIFICPVNGIYQFGLDAKTNAGDFIIVQIMRDSTEISSCHSDDVDGSAQSCSKTIIIECSTGELIWVRCRGDGSRLDGGYYKHSTVFGYLLYRQ